jgi:membrane associated rhomboid family serine protease
MVMPIADDNTGRQLFPVVNYILIAINVWVFVVHEQLAQNHAFIYTWSTVPYEIVTGRDATTPPLQPTPISVYLTLLTSMFMHGSIAHIIGNMWFLWIFGDNVEDAIGHFLYTGFYMICGLAASFAHVFTTVILHGVNSPDSLIPSLGASGAISGVLGGYMVLHPNRRVTVIVARGYLTTIPAWMAIGIWFAFQLISGLGMLGGMRSGVAYGAHIGGFIVGVALMVPVKLGMHMMSQPSDFPRQPRHRQEPW